MPKIQPIEYTEDYRKLSSEASFSDSSFCSPLAISMVTGAAFEQVRERMEELGRKRGRGTPDWIANKVLEELGFVRKRVDIQAIIAAFPMPHCNVLKNFTSHHPRRFPGCVDPNKKYLARCRGHILAITGGQVQDWSVNRSLRIYALEEIIAK